MNCKVVLFMILLVSVATIALATQTTYTFYASGDTYVTGDGHLNDNNGSATNLRIKHPSAGFSNVLVTFSQDSILASIGTGHVVSATLRLYIETNNNLWQSGSNVDVYRMSYEWDEMSATWNCGSDQNLSNSNADCDDIWSGGYYETAFSDSLLFQNNDLGWKSFDVTGDVELLANDFEFYGWLIRKRDYNNQGMVDFTSLQGTTAQRPTLVVVVDDQVTCAATSIDSILPGLIPSDGTTTTVTVSGQNLNEITTLYLDGSAIAYTLVNNSTLTFDQSYITPGDHQLTFTSSCLTAPIFGSNISADTDSYSLTAGCDAPIAPTLFSKSSDGKLCWNGTPTRLIGLSGFGDVTQDRRWNSGTSDADGKYQDSTIVPLYLSIMQYTDQPVSRGDNFVRIIALGASCYGTVGTVSTTNCVGYGGLNETMPFGRFSTGKFNVRMIKESVNPPVVNSSGSRLSATWKARMSHFLQYADQNGIAVMVDLFDENEMMQAWANNPWNPQNNNMSATGIKFCTISPLPPTSGNGLPSFYKIFNTDGTLNCLGKVERAYVFSIVQSMKNMKVCGPSSGRTSCANVLFEVMNEARYDQSWEGTDFDISTFNNWNNKVASWVKQKGGYLVAANPKGPQGGTHKYPCDGATYDDSCLLSLCTGSSCPDHGTSDPKDRNYYGVFFGSHIDIVALHAATWLTGTSAGVGQICSTNGDRSQMALVFSKPVIFDTDGDKSGRGNLNKTWVDKWAQEVMESGTNSCNPTKGKLHLYHTHDGWNYQGTSPTYSPQNCRFDDTDYIDCYAINALGDGIAHFSNGNPQIFCGTNNNIPNLTACVARTAYCENATSGTMNKCNPVDDAFNP